MRPFLLLALLLSTLLASAQPRSGKSQSPDPLRFTLILSRHGIRPPLVPNSSLNLRAADPWPEWEVPLGYLTPHGGEAIRQMGIYLRATAARQGLLAAHGCPSAESVYIYSDTDERNRMSSFHTFAGFEPGCATRALHTVVPTKGLADPLFSPTAGSFPPPSAEAVAASRRAYVGQDLKTYLSLASNPGLTELAKILAPDPAHPAAKPLLEEEKPLAVAPNLIEDLFLEYIDAKPMSQVGWGRVDAATLQRLMALHAKGSALGARTPLIARVRGSNLMLHILATLEQAADPTHPAEGAIGPTGARIVYVSGHDSNLYYLGGLLNLHWTAEGVTDDTPPDSQLVFELRQNPRSKQYSVRLLYRAQTTEQLRSASPLTAANPPLEVELVAPGCHQAGPCPLAAFTKATKALLDPAYTHAAMPTLQLAPVQP